MHIIDICMDNFVFSARSSSDETASDAGSPPPEFFSLQVSEARRFYLDLAPPPSPNRWPSSAGAVSRVHRIMRFTGQTFPYYSIEFVARGQGTLALDGHEHRLLPGSRVHLRARTSRSTFTTDRQDPLVKYFVDFAGNAAAASAAAA